MRPTIKLDLSPVSSKSSIGHHSARHSNARVIYAGIFTRLAFVSIRSSDIAPDSEIWVGFFFFFSIFIGDNIKIFIFFV